MSRIAPLALGLGLALLAGCGGEENKTIAHVRGEPITQRQLEPVIEHFREEAKREGRQFPDEGTPAFRRTRDRLVALLVYRTELKQAARRLGVTVTEEQVSKRLPRNGGEGEGEEGEGADEFARDSVEAQLLFEGVFRKVTRDVTAPTSAALSARRNRAMARFIARLERETRVRYEPGYAPGS
ncbi:MAG TPA: SurA N-terminal domain-containing protein [Gaiellaceae bacterium]|nr:SurA N-terminal domain-containing protein [Gaiellaceae bacterium]